MVFMSQLPTTSSAGDVGCQSDTACGCEPTAPQSSIVRAITALPVKTWVYLSLLIGLYASAAAYAVAHGASAGSVLVGSGFRQEAIGTGVVAVLTGVWLAAGKMLTELMPYWLIGILLAGALMALATWQRLAGWFRSGEVKASALAAGTGSAIPICSCGMAPLLGGMTRAEVPLVVPAKQSIPYSAPCALA